MAKRTPLYDVHVAHGARMVDFAGWDMPVHYGSQIEEHHRVRRDAGMFDVSHMGIVDVHGARAYDFLRYLLANDVARLNGSYGKALYTCMLNERGGVLDDLIVYRLSDSLFRIVVNAGTRAKDVAWMVRHAESFEVAVDEHVDLAMIAVQGPQARDRVHAVLGDEARRLSALDRFFGTETSDGLFVARTGYTGEDGYELMVPAERAEELWSALYERGVAPCGLGSRDTLRLEAGLNLYGQDMDEDTTPLVSGLAWTVAWEPRDRDFVGRGALEAQRANGVALRLAGLVLEGKGVLRPHQRVLCDAGQGEVTSGTFSPTLGTAVALARLPEGDTGACRVEVRGRELPVRVVRPPFVRNGRSTIEQ